MNNKVIKEIIEYAVIILIVILIRSFIATPIKVQQRSMTPTLLSNDIMILNKIGYYLNGVDRFDIVVIKHNNDYLIKRVIGLPGETLEYKDGKLLINDKEIEEDFINVNTKDYKLDKKIPKNSYFLVGDNRNNSVDSRIFGVVSKKDFLGKTNIILYPFERLGKVY